MNSFLLTRWGGEKDREKGGLYDIKESREARNRRYIMVSKERILEEGEKRIIPAFKSLQVNSSGRSLRSSLLPSIHPSLFLSFFISLPLSYPLLSRERLGHEKRKTDYFRLRSLLYIRERKRESRRTVGGLIRKWRLFDRFEGEESSVRRSSNHREVNRATGFSIG